MNTKVLHVIFSVAITILIGAIIYFVVGKKLEPVNNQPVTTNEYSNSYYSDYVINYPTYMEVTETGQDNRRAIIQTNDYKFNIINGEIISGFKIDIFVRNFYSFDNIFSCNKNNKKESRDCLLVDVNTQLVDYQKGDLKTESIKINDFPGVKYEFISNVGKNNNIGLIVKKDDRYYVILVAYRTYKDIELFNKILDSFRFK